MGAAILRAIAMLNERKRQYKQHHTIYYRPWIFLFTDGNPTDDWQTAAEQVRRGEAAKAFVFYAVGTPGANFDVLKQISISTRPPLILQGLQFREMFLWLSTSQTNISHSTPGQEERVAFTNPTAPGGWASL
jgi:uncharacterized protein YegL